MYLWSPENKKVFSMQKLLFIVPCIIEYFTYLHITHFTIFDLSSEAV